MKYFNSLIIPQEMEDYLLNRNEDSIFLEKIRLIHKVLQIKVLKGEYYEYKKAEIDYGVLCSKDALEQLNDFMRKLGISIPDELTKDELNVYKENMDVNYISGKFIYLCSFEYDYYHIYDHLNNYLCNRELIDRDFDNLRNLYNTDKFEFYAMCAKSKNHSISFVKKMKDYNINIYFQLNDYNEAYLRFLKAIDYIDKAKKDLDKKLRKLKINGRSIMSEYNNINFSIRESSFLTYNEENSSINEKLRDGHGADYIHSYEEINIYFNKFIEPMLDDVRFSLYHEVGHFIHEKYIESCNANYKKAKALFIKDYMSAFVNSERLRYYPRRRYYKYVAPPLAINAKRSKTINEDTPSAELFAELFRFNIMHEKTHLKLSKMFPHIDYLIKNMLNGKGVKKYINFKV